MKVQVNLSEEMVERVDAQAKSIGLSRSGLCAVAIGQYIANCDNALSIASALPKEYLEMVLKGGKV